MREYVLSADLADHIEDWVGRNPSERNYAVLAERAGVSTRAINKVLTLTPHYQTIFLADALLTAMGRHIAELDTVMLPIRKSKRNHV